MSDRTCPKWVARYRAEGEPGLWIAPSAPRRVATAPTDRIGCSARCVAAVAVHGARARGAFDDPGFDRSVLCSSGSGWVVWAGSALSQPALRAAAARRADPHRRQEARAHSGRRGNGSRRPPHRAAPSPIQRHARGIARLGVRSRCGRRLFAARLRRSADRRESDHGRRVPAPRDRVLSPHGITSTRHDRQRLRLPLDRARTRLSALGIGTAAPGPTGPRPTGKPNGSSAPCSAAGPTAPSTAQATNAPQPLTAGSGTTTINANTRPSTTDPRSAEPTCLGPTARARRADTRAPNLYPAGNDLSRSPMT